MSAEKSLVPVCAYRRQSDGFCRLHQAACSCTGNCAACSERLKPVSPQEHREEQNWFKGLQDLSTKQKRQKFRLRKATRYAFYRTCKRKHRYRTLGQAMDQARKVFEREGVLLAVYSCPFCGGYHLTKQLRSYLPCAHRKKDSPLITEAVA